VGKRERDSSHRILRNVPSVGRYIQYGTKQRISRALSRLPRLLTQTCLLNSLFAHPWTHSAGQRSINQVALERVSQGSNRDFSSPTLVIPQQAAMCRCKTGTKSPRDNHHSNMPQQHTGDTIKPATAPKAATTRAASSPAVHNPAAKEAAR
jgi:hypothetical protein